MTGLFFCVFTFGTFTSVIFSVSTAFGDSTWVVKKADTGVLTPNADLLKILVVDELSCNVVPKVEVAGFAVVKTSVVDPNAEGVNLR